MEVKQILLLVTHSGRYAAHFAQWRVGALDKDEIYHFFSVFPSES